MSELEDTKLRSKANKDGSWSVLKGDICLINLDRKDFPEWNRFYAKELVRRWNSQPDLESVIKTALANLKIITMPRLDNHVATDNKILKLMADSFEAAIAKAKPKENENENLESKNQR